MSTTCPSADLLPPRASSRARGEIVRTGYRSDQSVWTSVYPAEFTTDSQTCTRLGTISQDPVGFAAGDANLYRYVGNGPTNATDPDGFQEKTPEWYEARIKRLFEAPQQSWSEYLKGDGAFKRKLESSYNELLEYANGDPYLLQDVILLGGAENNRFSRALSLKLIQENVRMLACQDGISEEEARRRLLSRSREITGSYNFGTEARIAAHEGGQRVGPVIASSMLPIVVGRGNIPYRFMDPVSRLHLRGQSLSAGRARLQSAGLTERITQTGRHEFTDSLGRVRAAYDPISQQGSKAGHWHKFGYHEGQRYPLNDVGRCVDSSSKAAHIPTKK